MKRGWAVTAAEQSKIQDRAGDNDSVRHFVVLGGGVAGLAAARELLKRNCRVTVIEKEQELGGLARTIEHEGFRFDIGGHRFHSNNPSVVEWLKELLSEDLLIAPRKSHIALNGKFVNYPLRLPDALNAFSAMKAAEMLAGFLVAKLTQRARQDLSFEDWVVKRYGWQLYDIFFRPYTEKVWGMPCKELSAAWASQRIGIPSMWHAIIEALFPPREARATAISQFYYPRRGFGMLPQSLHAEILAMGGEVQTGTSLHALIPDRQKFVTVARRSDGSSSEIICDDVVSTIPLDVLLRAIPERLGSRELLERFALDYRDIICVFMALKRKRVSEDTWTYFPQQELIFARTHEPKNWSADMVPSQEYTSLAAEIFCCRGDRIWQKTDSQLADQTIEQMHELSWINRKEVLNHWVLRVPNAYPTYRIGYAEKVRAVKDYLLQWTNLHLLGRTGSFHYMNSDGVIEDVFRFLENVLPLSESAGQMQLPVIPLGRWV